MLPHLSVSCFVLWAYTEANRGVAVSERLQIHNFCFRRLNDTHQFGCSSAYDGNVGVVHVVDSRKDIDYVISDGPAGQYVPVVRYVNLTTDSLNEFARSGRVAGVLALHSLHSLHESSEAVSPDDTCPNRYSSFYESFDSCQTNSIENNQLSNAVLQNYPFPIFYLKNETFISRVVNCFKEFNKNTTGYSLSERRKCSIKMYAPMNAAVDSKTCLRRSQVGSYFTLPVSFCDPLESRNVFTLLRATEPTNETVVVAARMDSFSLFSGLAPGADSAVSGVVSLLSIANALTKLKALKTRSKNVLFALFNGEAFDYIGSSRCVYDLLNGRFKYNLTMANITSIIELSQLFLVNDDEKKWFAHVDPHQYRDETMRKKLDLILSNLEATGQIETVSDIELPVSSVRRFLSVRPKWPIASVVVTNFRKSFVNPYYNSILDAYGHRVKRLDDQAKKLHEVAAAVGNTIVKMISPPDVSLPLLEVESKLIEDLLHCYLVNSSCARFHAVVNSLNIDLLSDDPHPLYVSVSTSASMINPATVLTYLSLVHLTGEIVADALTEKECFTLQEQHPDRMYTWMFGEKARDEKSGVCVTHSATMTIARSPAFDGASMTEQQHYSTWTESIWSQPEMSLFVQASGRSQLAALFIGVAVFLASLLFSVLVYRKSGQIFDQSDAFGQSTPVAC